MIKGSLGLQTTSRVTGTEHYTLLHRRMKKGACQGLLIENGSNIILCWTKMMDLLYRIDAKRQVKAKCQVAGFDFKEPESPNRIMGFNNFDKWFSCPGHEQIQQSNEQAVRGNKPIRGKVSSSPHDYLFAIRRGGGGLKRN